MWRNHLGGSSRKETGEKCRDFAQEQLMAELGLGFLILFLELNIQTL